MVLVIMTLFHSHWGVWDYVPTPSTYTDAHQLSSCKVSWFWSFIWQHLIESVTDIFRLHQFLLSLPQGCPNCGHYCNQYASHVWNSHKTNTDADDLIQLFPSRLQDVSISTPEMLCSGVLAYLLELANAIDIHVYTSFESIVLNQYSHEQKLCYA